MKLHVIPKRLYHVHKRVSVDRVLPEFEKVLGSKAVRTSSAERIHFSKDEGHLYGSLPSVVLVPSSVEQVSDILRLCNSKRISVVPFGTGTGLEGGSISIQEGVCLSLGEVEGGICTVNESDADASVRPSVTRKELNAYIRHTDPGADASLCGMVATGASGTNAVRYGVMKENVLNLEVVLANGTVLYTRGKDARPRKSVAGLNLTDLFVGSEGILGVITMATLRLHARPSFTSSAVCSFQTLLEAINSVVEILQSGIPIARIEFMDEVQVAACNLYSNLSLDERPTLFLEFHGPSKRNVEEQAGSAGNICSSNGGSSFAWSTLPHEIEKLWTARHNAYYATLALRKGSRGFTTDVCVPISRLAQVVVETRMDLDQHKIIGTIVGHVGDGNFHVILPINGDDEEEKDRVWKFSDRLIKRALLANGTCTGEHGIGIGKIPYLEKEMGPVGISAMKCIKNAFDPYGILNAGKVLR